MYRSNEGISGFGRTDGRTDGQPENIMPPAPKGGGIKRCDGQTDRRTDGRTDGRTEPFIELLGRS